MPWTHRVSKQVFKSIEGDGQYEEEVFAIREFYFDSKDSDDVGVLWENGGWTKNEISPTGESLNDLEWALEKMLAEVRKCKEDPERVLYLTEDAEAEIK